MKRIMIVRPNDFVDISLEIPGIITDVKYFTGDNFVGERIDGYEAPTVLLTEKAALALGKVQKQLMEEGYGLKVLTDIVLSEQQNTLFDGENKKKIVRQKVCTIRI